VEFVVVAVLLLVPLVYVVLSVAAVQRTAYAATQAVREAGRAYVTSSTPAAASASARVAARLAMADQGLALPSGALRITCLDGPCLAPGSRVVVELRTAAALPLLPADLSGAPARVPVVARHVAFVESYRAAP
jgi:Flp pilus assembly protein TadG